MLPSRFHYSPYLLDSASETRTWVATVGRVISYGTSRAPEEEEALEPSVPEPEEANHAGPIRGSTRSGTRTESQG